MADDPLSIIAQLVEGLEPGALVTRFVVVAEIIAADGERKLWVDTDDDATRWDTYGLLTWALNEETAEQLASLAPDDDDTF
jgi:hypothetical protein